MSTKAKNIISWIAAVLLSLAFVFSGITKLLGIETQVKNFESWGYPLWLMYPIGISEIIFAVGLLIPKYRKFFAYLIYPWMVIAIYTHLQADPPQTQMIGAPIFFGILATIIVLVSRNSQPKIEA